MGSCSLGAGSRGRELGAGKSEFGAEWKRRQGPERRRVIGRSTASICAVALALLLLLASPVGTHLAGAILTRLAAASGWQLHIAATSGWVVGTPTLHGVRCGDDVEGAFTVGIEKLSYSPWSSQLRIDGPEVIVTVGRDKTPVGPKATEALRLPVGELPPILLSDGRLEVRTVGDSILFVAAPAQAAPRCAGRATRHAAAGTVVAVHV